MTLVHTKTPPPPLKVGGGGFHGAVFSSSARTKFQPSSSGTAFCTAFSLPAAGALRTLAPFLLKSLAAAFRRDFPHDLTSVYSASSSISLSSPFTCAISGSVSMLSQYSLVPVDDSIAQQTPHMGAP